MDYFKNKKIFIWAIAVLFVLNIFSLSALFVQQQRIKQFVRIDSPQRNDGSRFPSFIHFIKKEVGFSDSQIEEFRASRDKHMENMHELNTKIHSKKKQLLDGVFNNTLSEQESQAIIDEMGQIQSEIERANHIHLMEINDLCKDDQKEKLRRLMEKVMMRHQPNHISKERATRKGKFRKHDKRPEFEKQGKDFNRN